MPDVWGTDGEEIDDPLLKVTCRGQVTRALDLVESGIGHGYGYQYMEPQYIYSHKRNNPLVVH